MAMAVTRAGAQQTGTLDASPVLFTVMAAINAAGFDADLASPNNHPLRDAVRQEIGRRNPASLAKIKEFFAAHRKRTDTEELSQYISLGLSLAGPPNFAFRMRDVELPPDAAVLKDFPPLLAKFYAEAGIADLWARSQPAIDSYVARYHEAVSRNVLEANAYLRNPTSGGSAAHFQVFIELLAPPNQVQTRSYAGDYFVVVTPSPEARIEEIRYAYLFALLDPLATRNAEILNRKKGIADHAQRAQALPGIYKEDFLLLTTASLAKAVEARLARNPKLVQEALAEGYILTPYFAEQLPAYEKQEQAMRLYYPEMVKAIDLRKEDARLSPVEFLKEAPVRQVKVKPPEPPPAATGAAKTLEDAEKLYLARDLERARQAFMKSLQETDDKTLQARAYYGLARIAALNKDPELSERLFQKVLELSPDAEVKAWTYVYLGRLAEAAGERDQAMKFFESALAVEGAPEGARRAAGGTGPQNTKKEDKR